jgi:hypothetical protein
LAHEAAMLGGPFLFFYFFFAAVFLAEADLLAVFSDGGT